MHNPLFRLPRDLVKEWPEVFEDLYMNTMPVAYLEMVHLEFANGRVWQIDIKKQMSDEATEIVSNKLLETFTEYKDEIQKIEFKIDVDRLRKDINKSTKGIF